MLKAFSRVVEMREIVRRALPVFIGMSSVMLTSWADTVIASWLGVSVIAAIGISRFVFYFMFSFANGFSISVQSSVAAADESNQDASLFAGLTIGLSFAATLVVLMLVINPFLKGFIAPEPKVAEQAVDYLLPLTLAFILPFQCHQPGLSYRHRQSVVVYSYQPERPVYQSDGFVSFGFWCFRLWRLPNRQSVTATA
ncbi:MAG: MATE family efflux transporter [Hyphomicrobiales bacterium]